MDYRAVPSLTRMFFDQAARLDAKPCLWAKRDGAWTSRSWSETAAYVRRLARGLIALGVKPGDRVALVGENRPEWIIADLAIMTAGGITVPAYTTNTVADHRHIFGNTRVKGVIASTRALADRALPAAREVPGCEFLVAIDPPLPAQDVGVAILACEEVQARGEAVPDSALDALIAAQTRQSLACIIHTSGTGGLPKGVMLSHGSILHNCNGAYELLKTLGIEDEVYLSFLPLSHSYEHTVHYFILSVGAQIYYSEGAESLAGNMVEAKPTIMTAVPRLYETMHQRILKGVERQGGLKAKLFHKAVEIGTRRYQDPRSLTLADRLVDLVLERLVRDKVRARFGGRLKAMVSGGGPLNPDIATFFTALGVPVLQGYGQTESAPVIAANLPGREKHHTVGPPLADTEVRIAEDGEILVRGELVMQGYWNEPEATAATIRDGWLHTGDVGLIDEAGRIQITDRKKDFIKNAGGDMIAPARIEGLLALQPEIAQAMIHGDRRPYLVALIVPDADFLKSWAKAHGAKPDLAVLAEDRAFHKALEPAIDRVNKQLSQLERIRRFALSPTSFTTENEMMTPTLKVKRHIVRKHFGDRLEALYQ